MVEFQTLKADEVKFGKNNFLEVARKRAIAEEGENEFIAISRGFFLPDGTKRFKKSLAIPDDKKIVNFLADKVKEFCAGTSASTSSQAATRGRKEKAVEEEEIPEAKAVEEEEIPEAETEEIVEETEEEE